MAEATMTSSFVVTTPESRASTTSLIHSWSLQEASGNNIDDGSLNKPLTTSTGTPDYRDETFGGIYLMNFDASEGRRTADFSTSSYEVTEYSLEAIVQPTGAVDVGWSANFNIVNSGAVLSDRNTEGACGWIVLRQTGSDPNMTYDFAHWVHDAGTYDPVYDTSSSVDWVDQGDTVHVLLTFDDGTVTWYVDGSQVGTQASAFAHGHSGTSTSHSGVPHPDGDKSSNVKLAYCAIWERLVDPSELAPVGTIPPYTHHHIHQNLNKDDTCGLIDRPTYQQTVKINGWRNE